MYLNLHDGNNLSYDVVVTIINNTAAIKDDYHIHNL